MNDHESIRDLLGDAPDEARRAQLSQAGGSSVATTSGGSRTMDSNYDTGDPTVDSTSGSSRDAMSDGTETMQRTSTDGDQGGLSTADIANASSPTVVEERSTYSAEPAPESTRDWRSDTNDRSATGGAAAATADQTPGATAPVGTTARSTDATGDTGRPAGSTSMAADNAPLFPASEGDSFRQRWTDLQAGFVDEPRQAVQKADGLVAEVIQQLASSFAQERSKLEGQWDSGEDVSTEDLRQALQRYRSFFDRLLSM